MMSGQCAKCRHYRLLLECEAFPRGIPEPILTGRVVHDKPYEGDNGVRFEEVDNKTADSLK